MKNTFQKTCFVYLLLLTMLFCMSAAQAQQATTAAGGDVLGTGGNVAYSIGQVVYTTHSGTTGTLAQGVEQPYEISVVLGVEIYESVLSKLQSIKYQYNASIIEDKRKIIGSIFPKKFQFENKKVRTADLNSLFLKIASVNSLSQRTKKRTNSKKLNLSWMVGDEGFEPPTPSV